MNLNFLYVFAAAAMLAGCSKTLPCPVCYEDAWSREPFPGEAKQRLEPLTREDAQKMERGLPTAAE